MNLQDRYELEIAERDKSDALRAIRPRRRGVIVDGPARSRAASRRSGVPSGSRDAG